VQVPAYYWPSSSSRRERERAREERRGRLVGEKSKRAKSWREWVVERQW